MRKNLFQFLALLGFTLAAGVLRAQVSPNSGTAFPILSVGLGARAIGMGESFTAVADDSSALYYNPAGLAQIQQPEISLAHNLYLSDGFYDNVAGLYPLGNSDTLAFGARYLNYGAIDKRDNFGNLLGTYAPFDVSIEGAYGFPLDKNTLMGVGSQWIRQDIDGSIQSGLLWNLGLWTKPFDRFSVGVNLKDLGVETGGNSLPLGLLLGAAYRISLSKRDLHTLLLSGGGDLGFEGPGSLNAGFEYAFQKNYFLRGGYVLPLQDNQLGGLQGLDFGAGVRLGQFQLDYSFSFEGDLGDIQRFSLSVYFTPPAKAAPEANGAAPASLMPPLILPGFETTPVVPGNGQDNHPVMLRFQVTSEEGLTAKELYDRAETNLKMGLKKEALDLYLKAVDKDPNFEPAWNRLGRLFFDKSLESYRKALELDPQNGRLRDWLNHFQQHQ